MAGKRKVHTAAFKARGTPAAHKADRTVNELARQFDVHPTLIHAWKNQLLAGAEGHGTSGMTGLNPVAVLQSRFNHRKHGKTRKVENNGNSEY
jgi:transposase-like protein